VPAPWDQAQIADHLADTLAGWRSWSAIHQQYEGPWRELVHHSGRVLQALTFRRTGAIVAAPTTSLPEAAGGERNWDYRYTWVDPTSGELLGNFPQAFSHIGLVNAAWAIAQAEPASHRVDMADRHGPTPRLAATAAASRRPETVP
jgi:GH15 family glucan-1,4-alpha-glucosidase